MERLEPWQPTGGMHWDRARLPHTPERQPVDAYEAVTARILERIETGVVPRQSLAIVRAGFQGNCSTADVHRGMNVFQHGSQGFQSPLFPSCIQARELLGQLRQVYHAQVTC